MKQSIGEFLSSLRKAHGLTQQDVADRLDVSNRTISAWERGIVMPDILLLPALADLYEVTTDEILAAARRPETDSIANEQPKTATLKQTIAQFTMWATILIAVFMVGYALLFAGWYLDVQYLYSYRRELCLSLLCVGLIVSFLCAVILLVVWRRWETSADPALRFALRKRMIVCLGLIAGVSLIFAIIAAIPPIKISIEAPALPSNTLPGWIWEVDFKTLLIGYSVMSAVYFFLSVCPILVGFIFLKRSKRKLSLSEK